MIIQMWQNNKIILLKEQIEGVGAILSFHLFNIQGVKDICASIVVPRKAEHYGHRLFSSLCWQVQQYQEEAKGGGKHGAQSIGEGGAVLNKYRGDFCSF